MNKVMTALRSDDQDEDRGTRRFGYGVVFFLLATIFVWGAFAPLQSAAIAPGVVQVEGKRKAVEHLEGGIVAEIFVKRGDEVVQGQALMRMDSTQATSELQIVEGRLHQLSAQVSRLEAERDGQNSPSFADELLSKSESDRRAKAAISSQIALFQTRKRDRQGQAAVLKQRVKQFEEQLSGLQEVKKSTELVCESLAEEISDLSDLLVEGYVDKQRLRQLERSRSQALGEIADINSQIGGAKVAISEVDLRILQLDKSFKTEVVDELTQSLSQLYDLQNQNIAISDRVARALITSPADGYVLGLSTTTVGTVIASGEQLMEIVPSVHLLIVEAQVSPMDIDRVRIGQPAEIRFSVFKDAYLVSGHLVNLSPDRLTDAATGMPYYSAEVKIVQEDMALLGGLKLVPGMPAEVLIKTGQRTMLGYITSPLNRTLSLSLTED
jgi:membrane fusion protein, epimerase transport system